MALTKPRAYVPEDDFEALNLAEGEQKNADKRVDGGDFDDNFEAENNALAVRAAWGADFSDAGSDASNGYYTIAPSGIVDAEHYVTISDGTRTWKVKAFANDKVKITDASIVNGAAGPADYSDSAFIDSLHLWVDKTEKAGIFVDKTQIVLDEDAPNALTGEDIHRAAGDSSDLDADLTAVETAFAAEHNATTGAHDDGFLTAAMMAPDDIFDEEGFVNFLRNGSFERWPQGPNNAPDSENWDEYNATVERSDTQAKYGTYSALITTSGANQGIVYSVVDFANYKSRTVTVAALVYLSAAGDVEIRIDDGVGTTTGTAVTLAASWQVVYCTHDVDASASELSVYVVSSGGAATWYLDGVMGTVGDTVLSYGKSVHDYLADDDVVPVNWLLNPGFETWATENADSAPDYWVKYGAGAITISKAGTSMSGNYSAGLECAAATGITQHIGEFQEVNDLLAGKTVCLSAWFMLHATPAANTWRIELYDGTTQHQLEFEASDLSDSEWTQLCLVADLDSGMSRGDLEARIYAVDGETGAMYVEGACLNVGSRPMPGAGYSDGPSAWTRDKYTFKHTESLSGDAYVDLWTPVTRPMYPTRIDVYLGTGPGQAMPGGYVEYILHDGAFEAGESAQNLTATVDAELAPDADGTGTSATNTLANAYADLAAEEHYIRIYQDQTSTNANPSDITVIVTGFSVVA